MGNRLAAAERYADTLDFDSMFKNMVNEMVKNLPANEGQKLVETMNTFNFSGMRNIAVTSMVQSFNAKELNALDNFYGNPLGRSIMKKFPVYYATINPAIQQRMAKEMRNFVK